MELGGHFGVEVIGGFLSTILYGDAVGAKVSGHYRQDGHSSGVVVKRGSTILGKAKCSSDTCSPVGVLSH